MSIKIIQERGKEKEEIVCAVGVGSNLGWIIIPHTDPNRHYAWYPGKNSPHIVDGSIEWLIKGEGYKPVFPGGKIEISFFKRFY